jgi:UDP-2,3-diacylglucosamine pyrophosphatase LpxH
MDVGLSMPKRIRQVVRCDLTKDRERIKKHQNRGVLKMLEKPIFYRLVVIIVFLGVCFTAQDTSASERNKLIFISDLHMNVDANYSWLVHHADNLAQFLNEVNTRDDVAELVILGDLLDDWVTPVKTSPQSFSDVLAASNNAGIVAALQAVCNNPNIKVTYVVGNHDMLSFEDANKAVIADIFPGMNIISESPGLGAYTKDDVIWAEHGHRYCLFNAPDIWSHPGSHLPMGYFISRLAASKAARTGHVITTPDLLKILIKPSFANSLEMANGEVSDRFDDAAIIALFNAIALWSGNWPWDRFIMNKLDAYDTDPSVEDVAFTYDTIFSDWPVRQNRVSQSQAVLDDLGSLIGAANLIFKMPDSLKDKYPFTPRIILFGHTHQAAFKHKFKLKPCDVDTIYANTGTWIDSKPMTWVEIKITARNPGRKLYEVSLWVYGKKRPKQRGTITVTVPG